MGLEVSTPNGAATSSLPAGGDHQGLALCELSLAT